MLHPVVVAVKSCSALRGAAFFLSLCGSDVEVYSRTRIKETFGYKKRFHSAFMQDKLST